MFFSHTQFHNTFSNKNMQWIKVLGSWKRGSTQVLLCLFPSVLWLWHFLYSVSPHPVSSLYIYTFVVSRAFMAGAASHAGDADSFRAPGLTSGFQGSVNVHRDALSLVPQWQCISSFVFYIERLNSSCWKWQFKGSNLGMIFSNGTDQIFKKFDGASIFFLEYLLTLHLSIYHTIAFYSVF